MIDIAENAAAYFVDRHATSAYRDKFAFVEAGGEQRSLTYGKLAEATGRLGHLLERISGQPLDQYLEARLFKPLGMKDTGFWVRADQVERLATSYFANPETGALDLYDPAEGGDWTRPPAFCSAVI